jgi:hypothetical protein
VSASKHSQSVFVLCDQPSFVPVKNCREGYSFADCTILVCNTMCSVNSLYFGTT